MTSQVAVYSGWTLATCLTCIVATILHFVAFSTSYWIVSDGDSPFLHIGLHEVCFDNCHHPYCPGGDPEINYNGCYAWTFNEIILNDDLFREIKVWLLPDWSNAVRLTLGINLIMLFVVSILLIIASCWAFTARYTVSVSHTRKKDCALLVLLYIILIFLIVASLLQITGVAIFSANGPRRDYMPMAYKNSFGFSYWLELVDCILLGLCCLSVFIAAISKTLHATGPRDPRYAEDMMLGAHAMSR